MIDIIASQTGFMILLSLFVSGAIISLIFNRNDTLANIFSSLFAITGSVWGILFSVLTFYSGINLSFNFGSSFIPVLSFTIDIDKLSSFFIFIISLIALFCSIYGIGYVKHYYRNYSIGSLAFFYHFFIASMIIVVTASNCLFFLIAWEIMSIASYFLVVYEHNDNNNVKAGFLYLTMTHAGTGFIIVSFLLMFIYTGTFDFEQIKSSALFIPPTIKNVIFILALIGFGTKAGIIPFHIWLPSAHPAAPSHVSALMSGVMIKTGIYMMIRIFMDLLSPIPLWWGLVILVLGSTSSLLGVLYALTEHDIKRLLAYHSIENIGIILIGLGGSLTFSSLGMPSLALLGLVAALFHTLNHSIFKSLLFLSAGSVINQTHTRIMEEYGGLIKFMPQTALFFLIGSVAISALPPFNGFFSEWLTFQILFKGIISSDFYSKWIFALAAGSLAFTGGLALACFVKAFGVTFLARPRSSEIAKAKESTLTLRIGMGALALLSLLFGIFSGYLTSTIESIGNDFSVFQNTTSIISLNSLQGLTIDNGFASVSSPAFFVLFIVFIFLIVFIVKYLINRKQKIKIGTTWDCGTELTPRMEITATGFSRSIIIIFRGILKPSIQHEVEYHDSEIRYLPKSRTVILGIGNLYQGYFYQPLHYLITSVSLRVKNIQSGNINAYISYIFIALVISLYFIL